MGAAAGDGAVAAAVAAAGVAAAAAARAKAAAGAAAASAGGGKGEDSGEDSVTSASDGEGGRLKGLCLPGTEQTGRWTKDEHELFLKVRSVVIFRRVACVLLCFGFFFFLR